MAYDYFFKFKRPSQCMPSFAAIHDEFFSSQRCNHMPWIICKKFNFFVKICYYYDFFNKKWIFSYQVQIMLKILGILNWKKAETHKLVFLNWP